MELLDISITENASIHAAFLVDLAHVRPKNPCVRLRKAPEPLLSLSPSKQLSTVNTTSKMTEVLRGRPGSLSNKDKLFGGIHPY